MGDRFAVLVELIENRHYVNLSWCVTCKCAAGETHDAARIHGRWSWRCVPSMGTIRLNNITWYKQCDSGTPCVLWTFHCLAQR